MGAYIIRRLLLVIPTLLGIMVINFALTQFVPGGPIEQIIAQMEGGGDVFESISGGGSELVESSGEDYVGARGLPADFIAELEREFGYDKPPLERFLNMMWNYMRFDFGESYFRSISVFDLVMEKMPVSITLGLWSTLIAYLISIPLGIKKAVRDGTPFDTWTSGAIIVGYAIPGFLFAILLIVLFAGGSYFRIFPLRGLTSANWEDLSLIGKVLDYFW
ncbi:MAG: microcin ABC transporter permease, partial [Pseudomonadota bacterium]